MSAEQNTRDHGLIKKDVIDMIDQKIFAQTNDIRQQLRADLKELPKSMKWPEVKKLRTVEQKRILVTGGAGFVGSHLVDELMKQGHVVTVIDNFFTGRKQNVMHWLGHPNFMLVDHDVVNPFMAEVDQIYHLACPASPPHYQYNPIKTIKTSSEGT